MGGEGAQLSAASKVALVGVSSLCISTTSILLRQAEHNDEIAFSPIAASFFGELMKASVAFVMMACTPGSFAQARKISGRTAGLFLLPACLYVLTNNLRFFIVRAVNPGLIGVMWNLKIVVVALLYQCPPFNRPLSGRQWAGALLLVAGSAAAKVSQGDSLASDGGSNSGGTLGVAMLLVGLSLAASAGVSCEYAYKGTSHELCFPAQCSFLYAFGACLNLAAFVGWEVYGDAHAPAADSSAAAAAASKHVGFPGSLLVGMDAWAWAAVTMLSAVGFVISLIFKYIDTVAQVFGDVAAMFITAALASVQFGLVVSCDLLEPSSRRLLLPQRSPPLLRAR